ncbi:hypothetical protein CASFOL_019134 [Castilleja foliolosa]|uniref:Wound-responsive family protein n=1 Tax=Castilleja foliolosa TaxID=1961234 RepID=A0ABD3D7C1_9LAMI
MSSRSKAWLVAASIGAVEAMKDQLGVCRWNYGLKSAQQHAKTNLRLYAQAHKLFGPSSAMASSNGQEDKMKQSEESLRTVMYLSCWGPN